MVGVVFYARFQGVFFLFFQKKYAGKKYIETFLIYFIFPRKKRKIKKSFIVIRFCGNR